MKTSVIRCWLAAWTLVAWSVGCSSDPPAVGGAAGSSTASSGSSGGAGGAVMGTAGAGGAVAATTAAGGGGGSAGAGGGGGALTLVGRVNVDLVTDQYTGFLAAFFDGTVPPAIPVVVRTQQAGCMLLVPAPVLCEPPCADGTVCTGVSECTRRPMPVSVGTLRVQGLGGMDLELEPTAPTVLSYQVVPTLPYPPCSEGANVRVHADAFDLLAKCISPLTVTSPVPIPVTLGQPMHLTWPRPPPALAGSSRIQIELEISHHGGYKGEIDCDVPDLGMFDIPEPLVSELIERGRAGYPTVKVARRAIGVSSSQPRVLLVISSQTELEVDTGVISCGAGSSPPCPAGTTCRADFTCR